MTLSRLDPDKLDPEQFLKHEVTLSDAEVRAEIRRKAAAWVFPSLTGITVWVLTLITLASCDVISLSENLMRWLIGETVVAVMGFGGTIVAWAFERRKDKTD